jgi:hypothetical protein
MSTEVATIDRLNEGSGVQSWVSESVHDTLASLNANAAEMKRQAERAVVDSDETLAKAGDLYRVIRGQEKKAEDTRKKLIAPVKGWLDMVNALFKVSKADRDEAASLLKKKSDTYQRQREAEARAAAEAARKEAEERALRDAELAAKAGDVAGAEAILDIGGEAAAEFEKNAKPELVRGDYGSTVGTRKTVRGEVTDVKAFLRAIADDKVPDLIWSELLDFRKSGLNGLARLIVDTGAQIDGFAAVVESTTNFR